MASAIANCHSDVVWWLHQHITNARFDLTAALKAAVLAGNILMAEWLLGRGAGWPPLVAGGNLAHEIAARGRLDVLRWLDERNQLYGVQGLVMKAAEHGHLHVARWLIDRDAARTGTSTRLTDLSGEAGLAIHTAAVCGHLEVAQYLYVRARMPDNDLQRELQAFEQKKTRRTLRAFLGSSRLARQTSGKTMVGAAARGFLGVGQWLYAVSDAAFGQDKCYLFGYGEMRGDQMDVTYAMDEAASEGHLDLVKYLHGLLLVVIDEGARKRKRDEPERVSRPICSPAAMDGAAANGHLDVVQWLHQNKREGCTKRAMDFAAKLGHLGLVQWLHEHRLEGCSVAAMDGAATNGHLQVVQWLHNHFSSGCTTKATDGAAVNGHLAVVRWLHETRSEGCTAAAMDGAAEYGVLDVVKWLHLNRTEGCTTNAMDKAAEQGHLHVVQWLHNHRTESCSPAAIRGAAAHNHFEVFLFLHSVCGQTCTAETAEAASSKAPDIKAWVLRQYPAIRAEQQRNP